MRQQSRTPYVNGEKSHHAPISTHDIIELSRAFGHLEIRIEHHGERLTSLETRATAAETKPQGGGLKDLVAALPWQFLWGMAVLGLAAAGRLDWKLAASVLPRF
jgi:hypothetical protein